MWAFPCLSVWLFVWDGFYYVSTKYSGSPPASDSWGLVLQVCITMPGNFFSNLCPSWMAYAHCTEEGHVFYCWPCVLFSRNSTTDKTNRVFVPRPEPSIVLLKCHMKLICMYSVLPRFPLSWIGPSSLLQDLSRITVDLPEDFSCVWGTADKERSEWKPCEKAIKPKLESVSLGVRTYRRMNGAFLRFWAPPPTPSPSTPQRG